MIKPDRWQIAQKAEEKHETHSTIPTDMEWAKRWLNSCFSLNINYLREKSILEVGCGTGMIHSFNFSCEKVGIDPLINRFDNINSKSSAQLAAGIGEQLPFKENRFDIIIYYNVLDHTKSPAKTVTECQRVLKSGGNLLLSVNTFDAHWSLRRAADYLDRPHPHHFTICEVKTMFKSKGFTIKSQKLRGWEKNNIKGKIANSFFGLTNYNALMVL